jgi:LuxR family maltose regulon positive regulatory protein
VSVDEADNDPEVLIAYIAAALECIAPIDPPASDHPSSAPGTVWSRCAPRLGAAISRTSQPFVLVLDGAGDLEADECLALIERLIDHLGAGSQLAISGRGRSALELSRPRTEGRLFELGVDDLALDRAEAAALLLNAGARLDDADLDELHDLTEGWPAGLVLAALSILRQHHRRVCPPGTTVGGGDRFLVDYLRAEQFSHLSEQDMRFLTRSAVLDVMSASLCEAVVDVPDSSRRLADNVSENLFVIPIDQGYQTFRYQRLYREVLRVELALREPDGEAALCRRASAWHEARGELEPAITYAIRGGDAEGLARLVGQVGFDMYARGEVATLEPWLEPFDDEQMLLRHPAVAVIGSWVHALRGRAEQADRWSRIVDHLGGESATMPDGSPLSAWAALLRAFICRRGVETLREDADLALDALSPFSRLRAPALIALGVSQLLSGRAGAADATFAEAAEVASDRAADHSYVLAVAERSIVALEERNLGKAAALVGEGSERARSARVEPSPATAMLTAVAARVAVAQGDPKQARLCLAEAEEMSPLLTYALPWLAVQYRLQMGAAYLALADAADVRNLVLQIDDVLHRRPQMGSLRLEVDRLRQQVRGLTVGSDDGWATTLTTAELRLLPLLASHWSFREIGDHMFLSRNTIKTQAISIYRKLGVSSRTQALRKASELGLLDEVIQPVRAADPSDR